MSGSHRLNGSDQSVFIKLKAIKVCFSKEIFDEFSPVCVFDLINKKSTSIHYNLDQHFSTSLVAFALIKNPFKRLDVEGLYILLMNTDVY